MTSLPSLSASSLTPPTTPPSAEEIALDLQAPPTPPHRSHTPLHNLKRSDPFQFGSRYLSQEDDVYEFNAWDHVSPPAAHTAHAETQYTTQRASPVSAFDKKRFYADPAKWWNKFYANNTSNFFKNRKWLQQEFPILSALTSAAHGPAVVLEVGAGAGNTAFPIIAANQNPHLHIHATDFSPKAIDLIRANPAYNPQHMSAKIWDVASPSQPLPLGLAANSVDVVLLIFIFSALSPEQWAQAVRNVYGVLKAGGEVCFRDYGRGDLAQVRFKKGRYLEENFYVRGDGTRVYFFEEEELRGIWGVEGVVGRRERIGSVEEVESASGEEKSEATVGTEIGKQREMQSLEEERIAFEIVSLGADRRLLVNRQKQLKMYRCWMQGRFRKPTSPSPSETGDKNAS
ncbi:hypothetical protein MMC12_007727 [Toensbergia leucococca]|nr:hypothetical protein [Toensbergia leucococca]